MFLLLKLLNPKSISACLVICLHSWALRFPLFSYEGYEWEPWDELSERLGFFLFSVTFVHLNMEFLDQHGVSDQPLEERDVTLCNSSPDLWGRMLLTLQNTNKTFCLSLERTQVFVYFQPPSPGLPQGSYFASPIPALGP